MAAARSLDSGRMALRSWQYPVRFVMEMRAHGTITQSELQFDTNLAETQVTWNFTITPHSWLGALLSLSSRNHAERMRPEENPNLQALAEMKYIYENPGVAPGLSEMANNYWRAHRGDQQQ